MRTLLALLWLGSGFGSASSVLASELQTPSKAPLETAPAPRPRIDLTGYVTVKEAKAADVALIRKMDNSSVPAGFLGIALKPGLNQTVLIDDVATGSPAEQAGLNPGMQILEVDGKPIKNYDKFRDELRGLLAGDTVTFTVSAPHQDDDNEATQSMTVSIEAKPVSVPMTSNPSARAVIGITSGENRQEGGVEVSGVTEGSAAQKAGIKQGDIILKLDGSELKNDITIRDLLAVKKPGDAVKVEYLRGKETIETRVFLQAETTNTRAAQTRQAGWDDRLPNAWKKNTYKLAIIGVEYPDVKHNEEIKDEDWEQSMFSIGTYNDKSATGQRVFGSMADYYQEISYGKFSLDGRFVGWVEVSKKRAEYSSGSGTSVREKTVLLTEAMDKLLAKQGKDVLKDYDGVFFIYAGERVNTTRGGLYWPHRASVTHNGKRWPYFIVQEGGKRMNDISVFCHEFGHMLGLPDLYARPEVPGMEGVGPWCAMSQQNGQGRPQHFSVWSKDQLGWVQPKIIDPRDKQKIILGPINDDPTECLKVILRPDGTEYFLIENRKKTGFDAGLPAEGLLIWRVLPNNSTQRVFLEEAHGIGGPTGPRQFLAAVPYPAPGNNSFTPSTTPSSRSQLGGGFDVYITNIRRLPDGRITFQIGYEYQ